MVYRLMKLLSFVARSLSPALARKTGKVLGEVCWLFVPPARKRLAAGNIIAALSVTDSEAAMIAKRSATRFGPMFLEILRTRSLTPDNIGQSVTIKNPECLADALAHGRGVVLATSHSGNWEIGAAGLALNGFPLVGVVMRQTNAAMDLFINENRACVGIQVAYKSAVRDMLHLLGQGKIIGLLMDQDASGNGIFVDFFNRPASTVQGAAMLARMKDAPIVAGFTVDNDDGTHTLILHPAVWVPKTARRETDVAQVTQQLTKMIEDHVRQYPQQWFWLHNRWKTRPPAQ